MNGGSAGGVLARGLVLAPGRECGARQWTGELVKWKLLSYTPVGSALAGLSCAGALNTYLFLQGLAKIGGANYWNFATSPLVWSLELKLAPRFKMNELGEISSEI